MLILKDKKLRILKSFNNVDNKNLAVCRAGNFSTESKRDSLSTREVGDGLDEEEYDDDDDDEE